MALYSIIDSELMNNINKYNSYCITLPYCTILKILFFWSKIITLFS